MLIFNLPKIILQLLARYAARLKRKHFLINLTRIIQRQRKAKNHTISILLSLYIHTKANKKTVQRESIELKH